MSSCIVCLSCLQERRISPSAADRLLPFVLLRRSFVRCEVTMRDDGSFIGILIDRNRTIYPHACQSFSLMVGSVAS